MLGQFVKEIFLKFGFDIKRYNICQNQTARLKKIIDEKDINLIFDIGANNGQFGLELLNLGYPHKIVSFEPLKQAYKELSKNALKNNNWIVPERYALGENIGVLEINIAGNLASSSILPMMDAHISAAPYTNTIGKEVIDIKPLDLVANQWIDENSNLFLKIDTQGYEYNVLKGAKETLTKTKVLQLELSLIELYEGQKLFSEMLELCKDLNFDLWGIEPAFVDPNTGRMLQVDALFINTSHK